MVTRTKGGQHMNAFKNLTHATILGIWAVAGIAFSITAVFGAGALGPALVFWLWFAGFAAVTSFVVSKFEGPLAALATHGAALIVLSVIPRVFPMSLLRIGYDLLLNR
jgi:hypothetical protein